MKYCTRVGSKIGTQTKKSPKKILVFLFKGLKARWTDALSLFFLIGNGFTCTKNFRKTFQRLLGRKPRRFCDQLTFLIIQVFAHFLEFLKICPKMFPLFFAKMINLCLADSEKPKIIGGNWMKYCTVAKSMRRGRPIWTSVSVRARVSCALRPVRSIPVAKF